MLGHGAAPSAGVGCGVAPDCEQPVECGGIGDGAAPCCQGIGDGAAPEQITVGCIGGAEPQIVAGGCVGGQQEGIGHGASC